MRKVWPISGRVQVFSDKTPRAYRRCAGPSVDQPPVAQVRRTKNFADERIRCALNLRRGEVHFPEPPGSHPALTLTSVMGKPEPIRLGFECAPIRILVDENDQIVPCEQCGKTHAVEFAVGAQFDAGVVEKRMREHVRLSLIHI